MVRVASRSLLGAELLRGLRSSARCRSSGVSANPSLGRFRLDSGLLRLLASGEVERDCGDLERMTGEEGRESSHGVRDSGDRVRTFRDSGMFFINCLDRDLYRNLTTNTAFKVS